MNISIIIPNYNGEKLLTHNLPKVLEAVKYHKGLVEIIIPDDPSTDNSRQVIADFIKTLDGKHIIGKTIENRNKLESGFTKNVNRGVSLATGDILILLNSDVSPHKNFLEPLLAHFTDEKVFAVGCIDESVEGGKITLRGRGLGDWQRGFLIHRAGDVKHTNTMWVSGGSGAFRKTIWEKLGGLDTLYNPFYWEDIDLSYRALKSGYKIYFEPKSIVIHEHEKGAILTRFKQRHIQTITYRNQFTFIWKNITDRKYLMSHFMWLPYHIIKALLRRDIPLLKGMCLALIRLPMISQKRYVAQKLFIQTDAHVINEFRQ